MCSNGSSQGKYAQNRSQVGARKRTAQSKHSHHSSLPSRNSGLGNAGTAAGEQGETSHSSIANSSGVLNIVEHMQMLPRSHITSIEHHSLANQSSSGAPLPIYAEPVPHTQPSNTESPPFRAQPITMNCEYDS